MVVMSNEEFPDDTKAFLHKIALIVLSEEFKSLRSELEGIYTRSKEENVSISAFKDALFALLAQEDEKNSLHSRAY
jgi:hypothetical protein